MQNTSTQYDEIVSRCRALFIDKMTDYGSAWRILRIPSLTDQIFIKAQRIRQLQENEQRKIEEDEIPEFIGIINYSVMALIQLDKGVAEQPDLDVKEATSLYDEYISRTKALMEDKNHDYGEAWRDMRISSLTDLILQKLLRVKQIENNKGMKKRLRIVGYEELIGAKDYISIDSPMAQALLKKTVGDEVVVKTPAAQFRWRIKNIEYQK